MTFQDWHFYHPVSQFIWIYPVIINPSDLDNYREGERRVGSLSVLSGASGSEMSQSQPLISETVNMKQTTSQSFCIFTLMPYHIVPERDSQNA